MTPAPKSPTPEGATPAIEGDTVQRSRANHNEVAVTREELQPLPHPPMSGNVAVTREDKPLGYMASLEDWNEAFAGRPMDIGDWNRLTLGEQASYAARECKTAGAVYSSQVSADRIDFSISLPPSLAMEGLTAEEAGGLERYLHRRLEEQVAAILRIRQFTEEASRA